MFKKKKDPQRTTNDSSTGLVIPLKKTTHQALSTDYTSPSIKFYPLIFFFFFISSTLCIWLIDECAIKLKYGFCGFFLNFISVNLLFILTEENPELLRKPERNRKATKAQRT